MGKLLLLINGFVVIIILSDFMEFSLSFFLFYFIELTLIPVVLVFRFLVGKVKTKDGETGSGFSAILCLINEMINDHVNRKKTAAETDKIRAEIEMIKAETAKAYAEARNIDSSTKLNEAQIRKIEVDIAQTNLSISELAHANAESRRRDFDNEQIKIEVNNTEKEDIDREKVTVPDSAAITSYVNSFTIKAENACAAANNNELTLGGEKIRVSVSDE